MESPANELSGLRFYSVGRVAANKKRGSFLIEVVDVEKLPNLSGDVTDHKETMKAKIEGSEDTDAKEVEVDTTASIPAEWLPLGQTNRLTAPDVRRGEYVILLKFADAEVIYWMELKAAHHLRRLETITYAFSNERRENIPLDENNTYMLTISTHDKHVTLTTSKSDGEPYAWTIQLNTKEGFLMWKDDTGNYGFIDAKNRRIRFENADKTFVDLDRRVLKMEALDQVSIKTKAFIVNASQVISMKTQSWKAETGTFYAKGTFTFIGDSTQTGNSTIQGNSHVSGHSYEGSSSGANNNR